MNSRPLVSCRIPPPLTTITWSVCYLRGSSGVGGAAQQTITTVTPALHHPKAPECPLASATEITILESAGGKKVGGPKGKEAPQVPPELEMRSVL